MADITHHSITKTISSMPELTICIRPMVHEDLPVWNALEQQVFTEEGPWTISAMQAEMDASSTVYVVAQHPDGMFLGYGGVALLGTRMAPESELRTLAIVPQCQQRGIASKLLTVLLKETAQWGGHTFLEVRTTNLSAIKLYQKFGFQRTGVVRNYYGPGKDAFRMMLSATQDEDQHCG